MANSTQLLILGNGFDLHCGLKSSYDNFFKSAIVDKQGGHFGIKQLKAGVSGFWENLLLEYYKVYGDKNYNWCYIESIIQNTILDIRQELWSPIQCGYNNNQDPVMYYRGANPIDIYVLRYCGWFLQNNIDAGKGCSEEQVRQLLLNRLLQELYCLEKRFCEYLRDNIIDKQGRGLNTAYVLNAVNLLAKLTNFTNKTFDNFDLLTTQEEKEVIVYQTEYQTNTHWKKVNVLNKEFLKLKNVHILSFNYTALFDILLVDAPCFYNNVHGKLCNKKCEGCNSSNIIFGIDDSIIQSQAENSELRLFSKTYRKMLDATPPTKILPANNIPVTIKFYGHSLSKADYSYFQSIFDYYNLYGNNNVDLVFNYSKGYEQTDAIYALISAYGKTLNNSDQGKNLIHKLLLENRLKIQEVD